MKTRLWLMFAGSAGLTAAATPEQVEFFESRIRPVLAQECYECHSEAGKQKGGLLLDSRPGWQAGGDSGPAVVPGQPAASLLLQSMRHEHADLKMPKNGAQLDPSVLADFEAWIAAGAADPRDRPPSPQELARDTDWSAVLQRRKQWWAFAPLRAVPADRRIDDEINAGLARHGLAPAPRADAGTLRRRTSFVLTGLPPAADAPASHEAQVDALLASPQFGEKWARHFMDWVRYAESYGSEGDPAIPYAWRYRDYLIRAFNDDVPWPQLVREAIAGDLLPQPRLRRGLNESAIGIGQLRMVLHGFSPVDSLDEQVTFTDNQIDTVTKAFQALTVSCARCHNHKFDAISQADFYALYGIFTSTHPAVLDANAPGTGEAGRAELRRLKAEIKQALVRAWLNDRPPVPAAAAQTPAARPGLDGFTWFAQGLERSRAGEFAVALDGDRILSGIRPAGYFSDTLGTGGRAVLYSQRFRNEGGTLWFRVAGGGGVKAKYVVQNYPRTGTIHKAVELKEPKDGQLGWRSLDLGFWKGDEIFLQLATVADLPAEYKDQRSWFGLTDAVITREATPPPAPPVARDAPEVLVAAWQADRLTDAQAEALQRLLDTGRLPNRLADLPEVAALVRRYRDLEARLPAPTRVPGVVEADARDAALFVRGDHKQPADPVPRRFLDALDPAPFRTAGSGRLELAERIADLEANPLTARVIVNRLWHHVFGRGLVATPDNFGKLGAAPTHPELLDLLARRFIDSGGSIKALLRLLLTSEAFQRQAGSSAADPDNKLLGHWRVRRLEAEAIRDAILSVSGRLDPRLYGEPVGGGEARRSVYVKVVRNALDPFLTTFDAPVPFSSRGSRDVTNVPAQSLTLLNDPNVLRWSRDWAQRVLKTGPEDEGVRRMFREAFAREAGAGEVQQSLAYLASLRGQAEQTARELADTERRLAELDRRIGAQLDPVRARLQAGRPLAAPADLPEPLAEWTFDRDAREARGRLDLTLTGAARVEHGALVVDGQSMARSAPLPQALQAKTLEAWVQLDDLRQQGGGVLTVQGRDGVLFDSLVFAEKTPAHWVAGSNYFERSELFDGPPETEAASRPVHVAVVYQADGTVTGYRDGQPYGRTYRKAPGARFEAGISEVLLGCRHGAPGGNRGLRGRIFRARLYDRALSAAELARTARLEGAVITAADLLGALDPEARRTVARLQAEREQRRRELDAVRAAAGTDDPQLQAWTSLAQSLINLKEFIYLR